jgi:hypothetical protein
MSDSGSDTNTPQVRVIRTADGKEPAGYPEVHYRQRPKIVNAAAKGDKENKLAKLMKYLESIKDENFTGFIKVNYTQGSIGRIERFEEILRK